jgi:hypothetical protein
MKKQWLGPLEPNSINKSLGQCLCGNEFYTFFRNGGGEVLLTNQGALKHFNEFDLKAFQILDDNWIKKKVGARSLEKGEKVWNKYENL